MKKLINLLTVLAIFIVSNNLCAAKHNVSLYSSNWTNFYYDLGLKCNNDGIKYSGESDGVIPGTRCVYFGEGRKIKVTGYSQDYSKYVYYVDLYCGDKNTFESNQWGIVLANILLTIGLNEPEIETLAQIKQNHSLVYCESKRCYIELNFYLDEKDDTTGFSVSVRAYQN